MRDPRFEGDLHVVLVEPEIHWNTGSAGRTCLATGALLHLVEPLGFSLDERQVKRAGLDYWPRVNPVLWPDFQSLESQLSSLGTPTFFSAEAERTWWDIDFGERTALIFGSETRGLSTSIRERHRDRLVRFPMVADSVRSLNLANCVCAALYEVLRRRTRQG